MYKGAGGAGVPTKLEPPSVVRTIEVHTELLQGASPSSQNWLSEMAVNETGSKPCGTDPPADGPPAWLVEGGPDVVEVEVEVEVEDVEVVEVVGLEVAEDWAGLVELLVAPPAAADVVVAPLAADVLLMPPPAAVFAGDPPQAAQAMVSAKMVPDMMNSLLSLTVLITLGCGGRVPVRGPQSGGMTLRLRHLPGLLPKGGAKRPGRHEGVACGFAAAPRTEPLMPRKF